MSYSLDIIKSGVHKYLRRHNSEMMIRSMIEFILKARDDPDKLDNIEKRIRLKVKKNCPGSH